METQQRKPSTVDEYITAFAPEVQSRLSGIREIVKEMVPEAVERISYGMPAFYLNGMLLSYAAYKNFISIYPRQAEMNAAIPGLGSYAGTKGSIHFPLIQEMPYDLIKQVVLFRLMETQKKTSK